VRCIGNVGRNALYTMLVHASYPICRLVTDFFAPTSRFGCLWYLLQCWKRTRKETDAGLFILCGENASIIASSESSSCLGHELSN
jgi:hypothetical protein